MQENYSNIYEIFLVDKKPAAAWISIINQLKNKGFEDEDIKKLSPKSFKDLLTILREGKDFLKKQKYTMYFGDKVDSDLTPYLKQKVIQSGMSKEVFDFIYEQDRHTLSQRVEMYINIQGKIESVLSKDPKFDTNILNYNDIDDFVGSVEDTLSALSRQETVDKLNRYYDYIWDGKVYTKPGTDEPLDIYKTYSDVVKGGAKSNSEIVAEVGDFVVVHSNSKEAVQYWERGAVKVDGSGSFIMQTCTSRIGAPEGFGRDNYYHDYESYDIYQIIKKSEIENGRPKFYHESSNTPDNLFTLVVEDNGQVVWGGHNSVNADDDSIFESNLHDVMGTENTSAILDIISNRLTVKNLYFKLDNSTDEERSEVLDEAQELLENISGDMFFDSRLDEIQELSYHFTDMVLKTSPEYFLLHDLIRHKDSYEFRYKKELILKKAAESVVKVSPEFFFGKKIYQKNFLRDPEFNDLKKQKLRELKNTDLLFNSDNLIVQKPLDLSVFGEEELLEAAKRMSSEKLLRVIERTMLNVSMKPTSKNHKENVDFNLKLINSFSEDFIYNKLKELKLETMSNLTANCLSSLSNKVFFHYEKPIISKEKEDKIRDVFYYMYKSLSLEGFYRDILQEEKSYVKKLITLLSKLKQKSKKEYYEEFLSILKDKIKSDPEKYFHYLSHSSHREVSLLNSMLILKDVYTEQECKEAIQEIKHDYLYIQVFEMFRHSRLFSEKKLAHRRRLN